jgi:hypothetical protein
MYVRIESSALYSDGSYLFSSTTYKETDMAINKR